MIRTALRTKWFPAIVAVTYALFSGLWILFSDRILGHLVGDLAEYQSFQTYKGLAFILLSALVLYGTVRYAWRKLESANALLDLTSDLARLGGWREDLSSGRIDATRGALEAYGLEREPFSIGRVLVCHDAEDRDSLVDDRISVIGERRETARDYEITALDGVQKWVRVMQRPQIGPDGRVTAVVGAVQDISEIVALRRKAEVLTNRIRNMVDNMPDGFFLLDGEMRLTYANPMGEEIVSFAQGPGAVYLGKTVWEVFPLVADQMRAPLAELVSQGNSVIFLLEVPTTRSVRRVSAFITPDGIGMHVRDVTKDIRAQNSLRDSEERFRLASMASQDVLFDWDVAKDHMMTSEAARTRYGYEPGVFPRTQADFFSIVHPDDRERVAASILQNMLPGEDPIWTEQFRVLAADGSTVHVLERALTLRDGVGIPYRVVGTITDITAQVLEGERLRAIVDVASDAIYEYDPQRRLVTYSEGIRRTFGFDWVGEMPLPSPWRELVHPEDRTRTVSGFFDFCNGTATHWRAEYRMMRSDGRTVHVREKARAVRDEQGGLIRVIGSMEDVTAERRADERLKHAERIQAIGTLTGGVAHDFNNLLTIILGNAELLTADPQVSDRTRSLGSAILKAAERGADLTSSLLAFSGRQPLAPKTVDSRVVLAEMAQLLERTLPANVQLKITSAPEVWLFKADPAQLSAAILNLVVNSRDAMPEGGTLGIEVANETLDAVSGEAAADKAGSRGVSGVAATGDFVRITVTDTGTGIAPDVLEHVFEPFFTTKTRGTGTGLGLSMVHGFVQQSGGHMKVASTPGEGTSISILLPRCDERLSDDELDAVPPILAGQGEHVLVVEDNPLLLPHVAEMVAGLGYRVSSAADASAALEILRGVGDVDLLFTDVVLPGPVNGPALAKLALEAQPGLSVLFTSGYTENANVHHGQPDRDVYLLAKPYRRNELARMLRQVVDGRMRRGPDA